jgi:four helix bundle protein
MSRHHFEELEIWKRGSRIAVSVIQFSDSIKVFALRDQMVRAAISIPSNIAEGAERDSDKEFKRFLNIALGSCAELRTQCYIAQRSTLITNEQASGLIKEARELSAMIFGFLKQLPET